MARKNKSGRRLAQKLIADMREAYVAGLSLAQISQKFSVSKPTVQKYCKVDRWPEYAELVREKTRELSAEANAKQHAKNIILVRGYIAKQAQSLARAKGLDFSILGLEKAMRLEQLLLGEPDSRSGGSLNTVADIKRACDQLTTSEIRAALKDSEKG